MNYLSFLATLDQWVNANPDISAAAMVGSYVRGLRPTEPDIDIALISQEPTVYIETHTWLQALFSSASNVDVSATHNLVSVRFQLDDLQVELNFGDIGWARFPASASTASVVSAGLTILTDPQGLLSDLQQAVGDNQVIRVRNAEITDAPTLADIFYRSVHAISDTLYSPEQKKAWAPEPNDDTKYRWQQRIVDQKPFVAVLGDQIAGFVTLEPSGLIDLLFVDPACQQKGVARELYEQVLAEANAFGLTQLSVDASDAARPFFEARGFEAKARQTIERRGVTLNNTHMKIDL
ncbi:GNAT family N-acetyltransferase [Reinekea blandensis]|uniref:Histone acetyltransferase HPA2/related acetyltransferase n=1 Tax=Reinekea blandensis MED297 TaxID=314283 RepID=A4BDJ0_9GAMM|nr:GNAT family N-acetyltransferase [Reinekea blandensis]EAR09934.1 Histone acetyltransferase HPA2/related acetyltransferase [Reinekea sp. MED297] [Reinekea blandensis MED297]